METPSFKRTVGINKSQLNHSATCCGCKANEKISIYENKIYDRYIVGTLRIQREQGPFVSPGTQGELPGGIRHGAAL